MKTIYIINDLIQGGSTKSLLRIISSSNKENIIITLDPNSVSADFLNNDYKIYSLNFKTIIDFIKSFFKVKTILKNKKNYTLHCWLYKSCLIGWLIALINGNKSLIWNIRHADTEFNFLKLDSYLNLKYTKKHFIIRILGIISRLKIKKISIVFNSNFSKKKHLKIGYSSKNSFVITNGFNTDIYKNSTLQKNLFLEKYYIDKNLFLISMYARFHPIKNHEILRMTVLTPLGIELLSLELKNNELYKRSGLPGINIKEFERAMVDIIAIYAKQMDLKRSVRENRQKIQIEDTAKRRKFIAGEKTLVDIKYSSDDLWGGKIELTNTPLKYKLIINTLSVDYENIHQ